MIKKLFMSVLLLTLAFGTGFCIGKRAEAPESAETEASRMETILSYSDWSDSSGHRLKFTDNYTGALDGESFYWTEAENGVSLSYLPDSPLTESYMLKLEDEDGILYISMGRDKFSQHCIEAEKRAEREARQQLIKLGTELADYALGFEGCKYVYGGNNPETGVDCSGLVCYVFDHFGYSLKRIAADQAKQGVHVEPEELQPGDLLCFYTSKDYIGHVGIYLGDRMYIHAMGAAYGVVKSSLDEPYTHEYEARRLLGNPELMKKEAA